MYQDYSMYKYNNVKLTLHYCEIII